MQKKITLQFTKGQGPTMQQAAEWTDEQWEAHRKEVAQLKENGEFGDPYEIDYLVTGHKAFDGGISAAFDNDSFGILMPKGKFKGPGKRLDAALKKAFNKTKN